MKKINFLGAIYLGRGTDIFKNYSKLSSLEGRITQCRVDSVLEKLITTTEWMNELNGCRSQCSGIKKSYTSFLSVTSENWQRVSGSCSSGPKPG